MTALLCVLIAAAALALGYVAGTRRAHRRDAAVPVPVEPTIGPPMADLLERVFRSSESGLAVIGRTGDVVLHNARAVDLGLVRDGRPDARAWTGCQRVQSSGQPAQVDLTPLEQRGRR
ncbi:MAG: sensor histidine kinase, partial [Pseudonocardia sp.]|nr:sensor histidine kinase [Pseudonocardia sp.]